MLPRFDNAPEAALAKQKVTMNLTFEGEVADPGVMDDLAWRVPLKLPGIF